MGSKNNVLVHKDINYNLNAIKTRLFSDLSYDLVIREFKFRYDKKDIKAFLVFFDGMINKDFVNENILFKANSTYQNTNSIKCESPSEFFKNFVISNYSLKEVQSFNEIINNICNCHCGIFIDGYDKCFMCDMIKYEHRVINTPTFESSVKGTQESFNEVLNINTALIRKYVNDSNLIIEKIPIGKRSQNSCAVIYIKGLTNPTLVKRIKNRISNIDTDIIITTDNLSQFIETNTYSIIPQIMPTEKPDRVASFLMQGRCIILTNNSPIAGVIPTTIIDWFHSSEDGYLRAPFNFLLKLIRIAAILISLFLPALYIATVTYHIEILPTNIAMMLTASRDAVPFPFVVEVLMMEIAFELLREAETRVPTKVGPIVSIVGGLILGQLAVEANIICSFTMIIVGFTGICMYALPNYYSSYGLRNMRYILIILAFFNGYLALSFGVFLFILILANSFSIGTRLLPSFYIDKKRNVIQQIFTEPIWKKEFRPYYTKATDKTSQPNISRRWLFNEKKQ